MAKLDAKSIQYRKQILDMIDHARRGHIGSAFSIVEIVRVLYDDVLRFDPKKPEWPERDRFILSKGHGCLALYVALADKGFIKKTELKTLCELDSILGGHPDANKIPGVEASTGSLGHGLPIGAGIALSGKIDSKDFRTFVLLGDGECNEGTVWEAALFSNKHKLNRLIAIIDYNKLQCFGKTCDVLELEPFADKWKSFGFEVKEVDGHDVEALRKVLSDTPLKGERPLAIICHTVKGKGIKTLEGNASWHHKSRMSDELMKQLYGELGSNK
ncbi:transketolase [Candidatus Margulisiibacteriota bacterium]